MRIISGSRRGKRLQALEGEQVRPTTDMVKESLFNILQFAVEGRRFLDLFAGSGQIALEALSRGAASAVLVDRSEAALKVIRRNVQATAFENEAKVVKADFASFLRSERGRFDIAFLDPPYRTGILEKALPMTAERMNDGGVIVCEHPVDEEVLEAAGEFKKQKSYRYGKLMLTVYRREAQ